MTVDLKSAEGKATFRDLVEDADVVLENFRPGVLARLGFPWETLKTLNPRLVYCAISGFGQTSPLRARPAYDQVIQGMAGMMSVTGKPQDAPLRAGYPIADTMGGLAAAFGVCAALVHRERTGKGCELDVSMLDTAITALGWAVSNYLIAGTEPCRVLGRIDLVTDSRFVTREDRKANRESLQVELEASLRKGSALAWERLLGEAGVPTARVLSVPQALDLVPELIHTLPFPGAPERTIRVLGNGIRVNGHPTAPHSPPPLLGEHNDDILKEWP